MNNRKHPSGQSNSAIAAKSSASGMTSDVILGSAVSAFHRGQLDEAGAFCEQILRANPRQVDALHLLAIIETMRQNFEAAVKSFDKILKRNPNFAEAHYNKGIALRGNKQHKEALKCFDRALRLKPDYPEAFNNRGVALLEIGRVEEALSSFARAIALKPDFAEAYYNRGNALRNILQLDEALTNYEQALRFKPNYIKAANNRGMTLRDLRRFREAVENYDDVLAIEPNDPELLSNRGIALCDMGRHDEGLEMYARATRVDPEFLPAIYNRAHALSDMRQHAEAIRDFGRVLEIKPDYDFIEGMIIYEKLRACDWENLETTISSALEKIKNGKKASYPFPSLAFSNSPSLQKTVADMFATSEIKSQRPLQKIKSYPRTGKIRIGYFSPDFRDHVIAYLMAGLFEHHDKSKFELVAFSFRPVSNEGIGEKIVSAFDRIIDVHHCTDRDIALIARESHIDIAVDLAGHTQGGRPGVYALRAAPVQISYPYAGTMGGKLFDYLIADSVIVPDDYRQYYSEKIIYLPGTYQVNNYRSSDTEEILEREKLGLPRSGFIFCCFNNSFKIVPEVFDCWMRILSKTEESVLWLIEDNPIAVGNLKNAAQLKGVNPNRLIFAKRVPLAEHLRRHQVADLFLDTLPYNAHATASDALWAGVPVLTCIGDSFAARIAAGLLNAIELPELVVTNLDNYEALAIELATNSAKLNAIKRKLRTNRDVASLFNTKLSTRNIEAGYMAVYERDQAGLPPDHIYVNSR